MSQWYNGDGKRVTLTVVVVVVVVVIYLGLRPGTHSAF